LPRQSPMSTASGEPGDPRPDPGSPGGVPQLRRVLAVLWRCVSLLRGVKRHLFAFAGAVAGLALLALPPLLLLLDVFWTRVLEGQPLTPLEASLLRMDPAETVTVDALAREARLGAARRALAGFALAMVVIAPLIAALVYYRIWILQRINQLLRLELFDRVQALSLRFHSESRVGDAIYRIYQDSAMVTQLVDVLFIRPVVSLGRYLVALAVVALFAPVLALGLALLAPPSLWLGARYGPPLRRDFRRARETNAALTSRIQEALVGIRVIKAYGAEPAWQARFERASRTAFDAAFAARFRYAVFGVLVFGLVGLVLAGSAAWAAVQTRQGDALFAAGVLSAFGFTAWNLGLFNFAKERVGEGGSGIRMLLGTWGKVQDVVIGLGRVFELLDQPIEVTDRPGARPLRGVRWGVRFRDVHFRYQPERPALEGVDLEARPGAITAIAGPTGAGKSTLMALLLRLFDPERGAVEIDGADLRDLQVASLREKVAIALQENLLFGATIGDNIRFAVPEASDEAVREAARVACADEFIEALPAGYDTPLGERGARLSTGQRQRLSIARAVLKDAPILVLDEPTASLDADTELRVLRNLSEWGKDRVIFIITHRLSTIRRADRIVVLEEGRVAEQGSHADLQDRSGGLYRRLLESERGAEAPA